MNIRVHLKDIPRQGVLCGETSSIGGAERTCYITVDVEGGVLPRLSVFATSSASARRVSRGAAQGAQGQRRQPAEGPTQRKLEPARQLDR